MAITNYTTADAAQNALVNAARSRSITPSVQLSAEQMEASVLANILNGEQMGTSVGGLNLATGPGVGITSGTGTICLASYVREGAYIKTTFLIDLTGLSSSTTDLDIIGKATGGGVAFIGRITAAESGTIVGGGCRCLEAPAGGVADIDIYKATVGTGVFDGAATSLTGQGAVLTSAGAWTVGRDVATAADGIAADNYLYLTGGAAGTAAAYTAGRLLITLYGIPA